MARIPKVAEYSIPPKGKFNAILVDIIDVEEQVEGWGEQYRFDFETDDIDPQTDYPYKIVHFTGTIISPKSKLTQFLGWITNKGFLELKKDLPDLDDFIGRKFEICVDHRENGKGEKRPFISILFPCDEEIVDQVVGL